MNQQKEKLSLGVNNYVEHSMSILDRINELLEEKFEGKQNELAKKLGKKESEISKWLNGVQNFTIFTISKLEEAFEEPIISVVSKEKNSFPVEITETFPKYPSQRNYPNGMTVIRGSLVEPVEVNEDVNKWNQAV